jgi:hypothetical protein
MAKLVMIRSGCFVVCAFCINFNAVSVSSFSEE